MEEEETLSVILVYKKGMKDPSYGRDCVYSKVNGS